MDFRLCGCTSKKIIDEFMKDKSQTLLFIFSGVFIIGLFFILGLFLNTKNSAVPNTIPKLNEIEKKQNLNDSLLFQYQAAVNSFDNTLDTTAVANIRGADKKLVDYYKLKQEIAALLKNDPNAAALYTAKLKIELLQVKIEELRNRNITVAADNQRLNAIIRALSAGTVASPESSGKAVDNNSVNRQERGAPEPGLFVASDLRINLNNNGNSDVGNSEEPEKISGSFLIRNSKTMRDVELYVVLQQPNGTVLRNSAWESGIFNTNEGQRKVYSLLMKFDYNKDELRRCDFSIPADGSRKGKYTLQLYHKGTLIANLSKILS
jgi:hypothetical protein